MEQAGSTAALIEERAGRLAGLPLPARDRERLFAELLVLMRPRIARLVRQYGLGDMAEDAHQVAAIGLHRALASFDPARAQFVTHAGWQMRGELQGLRHRVRLDQRRSALAAGIVTVALDQANGPEAPIYRIADDSALPQTESAASEAMAAAVLTRLLDRIRASEETRAILADSLWDRDRPDPARTPEQRRQVVRRTLRHCIRVLAI